MKLATTLRYYQRVYKYLNISSATLRDESFRARQWPAAWRLSTTRALSSCPERTNSLVAYRLLAERDWLYGTSRSERETLVLNS